MTEDVARLIGCYGCSMVLIRGEEKYPIRAFLQETGSKSRQASDVAYSPIGQIYPGLYVYIGPARPEAKEGDLLVWQERVFQFRRCEKVMLKDRTLYCWGLCVERNGEAGWQS